MCKTGLQVSKEGIRTYLKSQGYKSLAQKEGNQHTDIQKDEWSGVISISIMTGLKSFLLMSLLLNEGVDI